MKEKRKRESRRNEIETEGGEIRNIKKGVKEWKI